MWTQQLWCLFNFFECGSPASAEAVSAAILRGRDTRLSSVHLAYATNLYNEVLVFCRQPKPDLGCRGVAKLNELISRIRSLQYDNCSVGDLDGLASQAQTLDPSRVSLPSSGGILKPENILRGEKLQAFLRMPSDIPQSLLGVPDIKACHKVKPRSMPQLLRKLHDADMITFIPASEALYENGKLVSGGLFAVPHKAESDRLINDRRPFNIREKRLVWARLPNGSQLTQLIIPEGFSLRCSGDDLSNYFYLIRHLPAWIPRNVFGREFDGALFPDMGLTPGVKYVAAFKVLCMGDCNAVDIAQEVHRQILADAQCMSRENTLEFGKIIPATSSLEGLYIDDHLVFQILPCRGTGLRENNFDQVLLRRSRQKYTQLRLPVSEKKAFTKQYAFKAWGTEVCSRSGRVGAPYGRLQQILHLVESLIGLDFVSLKAMQKLTGLFVHPFLHNRLCMSVFSRTYKFMSRVEGSKPFKLPCAVKEELLQAALLLPVSHANIRMPVAARISCTDASLSGGGRACTLTSPAFAQLLYRIGVHNGEYSRLDWSLAPVVPPSSMDMCPTVIEKVLLQHRWIETHRVRYNKPSHINLLEMRMVKEELKDLVHRCPRNLRTCNLVDSRVVAGAWAKGRSSSVKLNRLLRSCLGWAIAGGKRITNVWISTHSNPADHPSRGLAIPPPAPLQEARELLQSDVSKKLQLPWSRAECWDRVVHGTSNPPPKLKRSHTAARVFAHV